MKRIDIIGQKFGRLKVISEYKKRDSKGRSVLYVKCLCDCGNIADVRKEKVLRGHTKSCGCLLKETQKNLGNKFKKAFGEAAFNECYYAYKKSAKQRNYSFELSKEEFKEIITQPCIYCGESLTQEKRAKGKNGTFKYTGIDRYDNSKGYVVDNCVPCCQKCNRIKGNMSIEEMLNRLEQILSNKDTWKRVS